MVCPSLWNSPRRGWHNYGYRPLLGNTNRFHCRVFFSNYDFSNYFTVKEKEAARLILYTTFSQGVGWTFHLKDLGIMS